MILDWRFNPSNHCLVSFIGEIDTLLQYTTVTHIQFYVSTFRFLLVFIHIFLSFLLFFLFLSVSLFSRQQHCNGDGGGTEIVGRKINKSFVSLQTKHIASVWIDSHRMNTKLNDRCSNILALNIKSIKYQTIYKFNTEEEIYIECKAHIEWHGKNSERRRKK